MAYLGRVPSAVPVTADDIPNNSITSAKILDNVITIDDVGPDAVGISELSASGTAGTTTYLRGDNAWTVPFSVQDGELSEISFTSADNTKLDAISGTNTGDQTITLTGDVTGSGTGSFAGTIKDDVALGGDPTTTTQSANDNSTKIATTAYVQTELTDLIDGAPGTLDTLNELAAAINDDASYASTLTTALGTKVSRTSSTGSAELPAGTTGERDSSPSAGYIRWNTTDTSAEVYDGSAWAAVGGGNTTDKGLYEMANTIAANYTITSGNNALTAGPITVNNGVSVTIPSGSTWVIA